MSICKRYRPATFSAFTLIELLVVIAIIGLLSSVVLASLNTARKKAVSSAAAETMSQILAESYVYYDSHGTYNTSGWSLVVPCSYFTSQPPRYSGTMFSQDSVLREQLISLEKTSYASCGVTGDGKYFAVQYLDNGYQCVSSVDGQLSTTTFMGLAALKTGC